MSISETELRDILKIVRQLERVLENALRSEEEKNQDRIKEQLRQAGVEISDYEDPTDAFEL